MNNMSVKEFLSRYKKLGQEIESLQQELTMARSLSLSIRSSEISDMPKSQRFEVNANFTRAIESVCLIESVVGEKLAEYARVRLEIESVIGNVEDSTLRTLLRYRYINGYTFERVAVEMNYSYMQVCRLHGKAIDLVKKFMYT